MEYSLTLELQKKIGQYFKDCRLKAGYSLRQLDPEIGIDYSHIAKIERGEGNLTLETLSIFIKFFRIQPDALFNFKLDHDFDDYSDKYSALH
jgi:transcriptional regulator with XRE-family HTH domain